MRDKKSTKKDYGSKLQSKAKEKREIKTIEVGDTEDIKIVELNIELLLESIKACPNLTLCPAYLDEEKGKVVAFTL